MPSFHTLAASSGYLQTLLERFDARSGDVPQDWKDALELLAAYFPHALSDAPSVSARQDWVRRYAHICARLDPLGRPLPERWNRLATEIALRMEEMRSADSALGAMVDIYTGPLAVETGHMEDPARVAWIYAHRESAHLPEDNTRRRALEAVVRAEGFERFMAQRFVGRKRFGVEGAESLHALIQRILDRAAAAGVEEVIVGTMHRGRLGLMGALFGQDLSELFGRMQGQYPLRQPGLAADVPYHLGLTSRYQAPGGTLTIRLLPNPSHLEAINAVALGYARSRQDALGSTRKVLPLILHTDASVAAQGVVAEAIQLSELPDYRVGGAIHVIVNNQIGFTTEPHEGRSARHCTAPWKAVDSLIAHVNAHDVDAVLGAADLSFDFREQFAAECVVDLVCIRANGHNEVDEPRFTQPGYYQLADRHAPMGARYAKTLAEGGIVSASFRDDASEQYRTELDAAFATEPPRAAGLERPVASIQQNAVNLDEIAARAARVPAVADLNPKAVRLVMQRGEEWHSAISWATAELLALGAILSEGWHVRLSGQDVDRGAFSQRHLSLVDAQGRRHAAFEPSPADWGNLQVVNSPLCEYAALSFEYGYSVAAERTLTVWEAQFGDFANMAQAVFDQFIASAAEKWELHSNLVVLLPHGLEGQGPEHSSARMERMLQLAARDNLRIAHPTTPANYFHLLVSQRHDAPVRPLIVFTPKKLLRLKAAASSADDLRSGRFQHVLVDGSDDPERMVFCSGKLFYDLSNAIAQHQRSDVTLIRLELIYPFPAEHVSAALRKAPRAMIVWAQEEPANFGLWSWVRPHLETAVATAGRKQAVIVCESRPESSSPAGSFHTHHESEQLALVARAIGAVSIRPPSGRMLDEFDPLAARTL